MYVCTYLQCVQKLHSCLTVKLAYVCIYIRISVYTCIHVLYACMYVCAVYVGLKQLLDVSTLVIPIDVFNSH